MFGNSSKKKKGQKVANSQTLADYWSSNPPHYYIRQSIVLAAEISFLVCCSLFFYREGDQECYVLKDVDGQATLTAVHNEFRKVMILLLVLHVYMIIKVSYFAWTLKRKEEQGTVKCCLQCWCCYTTAIAIYI